MLGRSAASADPLIVANTTLHSYHLIDMPPAPGTMRGTATAEEGTTVFRGVMALDGPSGTGKSTVAKHVATQLAAGYLDTGAMYRAVTLAVLRAGTDLADDAAVLRVAESVDLRVSLDPAAPGVWLGDEDVATEIRGDRVTLAVSAVSAVAEVRTLLVAEQRRLIAETLERIGGIVVEGRDIGAVVVPDAALKIFLTASADARARRRTKQDTDAGRSASLAATRIDVDRRDTLDSTRAASPTQAASDAVLLDTTHLDLPSVVTTIVRYVDEREVRGVATGPWRR